MIRSMTGFGRGEAQESGKCFTVEMKTVNHRYSDVSIKMPKQISYFEDKIRNILNKFLSRGKIDVFISYDYSGEGTKNAIVDEALAKAYINAILHLKEEYKLVDEVTLSLLSRFPDVIRIEAAEEDEEKLWIILKKAIDEGLASLVEMRETEGQKLKEDLQTKIRIIGDSLRRIKIHAPDVVKEYKIKLHNRISELMDQKMVDETRLAMEIAIFADRCGIDEEIVRLESHLQQFSETLDNNEPIGRKLDFLVQEMIREVNTIGSKANDLIITKEVLDVKSEIEKIREQVQNIE